MAKPMMIARFRLDPHNTHYQVWGAEEMVNGTVGGSIAVTTGGFVNTSGELDESGRYFVVFGVCEAAAKLYDLNPEAFMETVFSAENRKEFGVSDLTITCRGESLPAQA